MIALLAGCAAPTDAPAHSDGVVVLTPAEEVAVDPSTAESQTHPTLAHAADGRWLVAWDVGQGSAQRADTVSLGPDGHPDATVATLAEANGAGFTTPDVVSGDGDDWHAVLRVASEIQVLRRGEQLTEAVVGTGELGFWSAPDLARVGDALVVGWWDGPMQGAASYVVTRVGLDLQPIAEPAEVARSELGGSPMAIEALPSGGWVMAWSELDDDGAGEVQLRVIDASGEELARARADDVDLPFAPSRPALAVAEGAVVVGWRAQDDAQQGFGTRLRWFGTDLVPRGGSIAVGLAPDATNRIELATDGGRVAAVWEEATADSDVVVQLFDLGTAAPLTGPLRVHDALDGQQARPTVELVDGPDGAEVAVAFESGPVAGAPQVRVRRFVISTGG